MERSVSALLVGMVDFEVDFDRALTMLEPGHKGAVGGGGGGESIGKKSVVTACLNAYRQMVWTNSSLCKDLALLARYLAISHAQIVPGAAVFLRDNAMPRLWSMIRCYR